MGLQRVGILLVGVGVFVGSIAMVLEGLLNGVSNLVLGSAALVVLGVLVGAVGVVRDESQLEL